MDTSGARSLDSKRAAELMAQIVRNELGIKVKPEVILDIFARRWSILSTLAHAIHRPIEYREELARQQADAHAR